MKQTGITRIPRTCITHTFDRLAEPVAEVDQGAVITFETLDAHGGRVRTLADALSLVLPHELSNPATGPVFVRGAEPGDTLAISILDITLGEVGHSRIKRGGARLDGLQPPAAVITPIRDGMVEFGQHLRFAARPMVGVAGVAPAGPPIHTFYPGSHGGNLDINELVPGSTLYLPVAVSGALLCLGDAHAAMGDGELSGGGLDIDAEVSVSLRVFKGLGWPRPVIETSDAWCACAHAARLEDAIRQACGDMRTLLARSLGLSHEEAFMLIGAVGHARIGQSAGLPDVDATAYVRIDKTILPTPLRQAHS
jgi:amidase